MTNSLSTQKQRSDVLKQFQDFVRGWEFNDVRRFRPEFFLAWLTEAGKSGKTDVPAARDLYKRRKQSMLAIDKEMLRILRDDIKKSMEVT